MFNKMLPGIIAAALLISGCVTTPSSFSSRNGGNQPEWVNDINSAYSSNQYLAVLGEGDSLSKAQAKAAANMALIFESRIIVDTTIENRYAEMHKQGVLTSTSDETLVADKISQLSDQTLLNLKFGESWTNNMGTVIVAAYINRRETAELYRNRINEQTGVLLRLKTLGDDSFGRIERYAYYDSAYVIAMSNEIMLEQLDIISPAAASMLGTDYELADIKTSRTDAFDQMTFRLAFSGDTQAKLSSTVSDMLTDIGFSVSDSGDIAVAGSLHSEKIERNNDYENYKWYLLLEVVDETGTVIISVDESGISASTSESAARSRINVDVEKVINKEFSRQFNSYLNSFMEK